MLAAAARASKSRYCCLYRSSSRTRFSNSFRAATNWSCKLWFISSSSSWRWTRLLRQFRAYPRFFSVLLRCFSLICSSFGTLLSCWLSSRTDKPTSNSSLMRGAGLPSPPPSVRMTPLLIVVDDVLIPPRLRLPLFDRVVEPTAVTSLLIRFVGFAARVVAPVIVAAAAVNKGLSR